MVANKTIKNIPESFESVEQAGEFWDTHSLADFEDRTKSADITFDITKRIRYISVPEKVYQKISQKAKAKHLSVKNLVYSLGK
jgi:glucose-6-phosphate 1-dehydrogenase